MFICPLKGFPFLLRLAVSALFFTSRTLFRKPSAETPHLISVSALSLQSSSNLNFRLFLQRTCQLIIF